MRVLSNHPSQEQDTLKEPRSMEDQRTTQNRDNQDVRLEAETASESHPLGGGGAVVDQLTGLEGSWE